MFEHLNIFLLTHNPLFLCLSCFCFGNFTGMYVSELIRKITTSNRVTNED